jgi:hypothetical protein
MEYVHGKTLDALASHCTATGTAIPFDFSCYVMRDVCKVLAYAHNLKDNVSGKFVGIIHRDISPQNVIFSYEGEVKLFDFGIAKMMSRDSSSEGSFQGKPAYMAPEQARGEELDNRTDIFTAGIVLWELLTGQKLFASEQPLLAIKNVSEKPIPPPSAVKPSVPKSLDAVVMKALQRPADARYQSAQQFASELDRILNALCPGYGTANAAKFIEATLGRAIERDNAEVYQKMHAEMPAATPPDVIRGADSIDLPLESAVSLQPEWVRTKAEIAFAGERNTQETIRPNFKPTPKGSIVPPKVSIENVPPQSSNKGVWIAAAVILCLGGAWYFENTKVPQWEQVAQQMVAPTNLSPKQAPAPVAAAPVASAPSLPVPPVAPAVRVPAAAEKIALGNPTGNCGWDSPSVCAIATGALTTFENSCAADAAKAVILYSSSCKPDKNPSARFKVFRLQESEWRLTEATSRAAVFNDELDIELVIENVPSFLQTRIAIVSTEGKVLKVQNLTGTKATMGLSTEIPRGTYDLEVFAFDDKGNTLSMGKSHQPFFLGVPGDIKTKVFSLPGAPAQKKAPASVPAPYKR